MKLFVRDLVIGHTPLGTRKNDRTVFLVFGVKWNPTKTGLFDYEDSISLFTCLFSDHSSAPVSWILATELVTPYITHYSVSSLIKN